MKKNDSFKYQLECKDEEISYLKDTLSTKDCSINKLQAEKEKIQNEIQKFKNFWHRLMKHFQNKIGFDKDSQYKYVADALHKAGIFSDNEFEIARITELSKEEQNKIGLYLFNILLLIKKMFG